MMQVLLGRSCGQSLFEEIFHGGVFLVAVFLHFFFCCRVSRVSWVFKGQQEPDPVGPALFEGWVGFLSKRLWKVAGARRKELGALL